VRISGGRARGIPLVVPRGDAVRPATDGLRQAVFSSLAARVAGAHFWDLFAGSGAYGLEALSRGAVSGLFVEQDRRAAECLRKNLAAVTRSLGREGAAAVSVIEADVQQAGWMLGPKSGPAPDLIFVDPPYAVIGELAPALFKKLGDAVGSGADGLVVFEMPGDMELTVEGWECVKRLGRGTRQPTAAIYRRS